MYICLHDIGYSKYAAKLLRIVFNKLEVKRDKWMEMEQPKTSPVTWIRQILRYVGILESKKQKLMDPLLDLQIER